MKLNEYIFNEYTKSSSALSADDIERWIAEWYKAKYARLPPIWLIKREDKE